MFELRCVPNHVHDHLHELDVTGGITESIFPNAESLLLGDTDYQRALEYVAARKQMELYWSMMDFLFCELHLEWRSACLRFYAGNGLQLKNQITAEQVVEFDRRLVKALQVARQLFVEQRCDSWVQFKHVLRNAA